MNPVEIPVDIELEQNRRMITRSACRQRLNSAKAQTTEIKFINEHIDDANRIILTNLIIQSFGKQCALAAVIAFNKTLHKTLPTKL